MKSLDIESLVDISSFREDKSLHNNTEWLFVIKSQDQEERRKKMIEYFHKTQKGSNVKIGRTEPRPTAVGLLVKAKLLNGEIIVEWQKELPEPRHIIPYKNGRFLVSDVNTIKEVDADGKIYRVYKNPLFAFLHTINLNHSKDKLLVTSSGYDLILEIDLNDENETYRWLAWENGFNPDEDGIWLALNESYYQQYLSEGKNAEWIKPEDFGEQGIVTARRSAHPNVATYDVNDEEKSMIVSLGHGGDLYRVNFHDFTTEKICDFLSQMPHGLAPYRDGWMITNTTKGECIFMNKSFERIGGFSISNFKGKIKEVGTREWIQQVIHTGDDVFFALDANRGLISIDLANSSYNVYQPDSTWCFQDAIMI